MSAVPADAVVSTFVCPRCRGELEHDANEVGLRCRDCKASYPRCGGAQVLLPRARDVLTEWGHQLDDSTRRFGSAAAKINASLVRAKTESSRERLNRFLVGIAAQRDWLDAFVRARGIEPSPRPGGLRAAGTLTQCWVNVLRDWAWPTVGNREHELATQAALGPVQGSLGRVLVLGAGACRLAHDIRAHASMVIALDVNPVPMWVANSLLGGEGLTLHELAQQPADPAGAWTAYTVPPLTVGQDVCPLHFVLADGIEPSVRPGSVDTLVTPWFIDQIVPDLCAFSKRIHALLAPEGRWLNFGPLIWNHARMGVENRYTKRELVELISACGFEVVATRERELEYLRSPTGTQTRLERVLTTLAVKR